MKILAVLILSVFFSAAECKTQKNSNMNADSNTANSINAQKKQIGDLEYEISVEKVSDTFLTLRYEVKNLGNSKYILYNQGIGKGSRGTVFVEPLSDGTIELSQKRFFEPKDKECPLRETPIYFAASWLKGKQTIKEEVGITLPLKLNAPFDDCEPRLEMLKEVKNIRFCLGAAKVNSTKNLKANEEGIIIVRGGEKIEEQQLLCSDIFELK